jgi:DNA polymerase III delta subunit
MAAPRPLNPRDLPGVLARDPFPSAFVLLGEEQELKDEVTADIESALARSRGVKPERYRLDCEEESLSSLSATYLVGSLFTTAKLVVFTRFEKAPVVDRRAFLTDLSRGDLHPCLVVVVHSTERGLPTGVDGSGLVSCVFWPLNQAFEIESWIRGQLGRLGLKAGREVAPFLHDRYGNDLGRIRRELEKAKLVAGGGLTVDLLERVCSAPPGQELFGVLDAWVAGRSKEALAGLRDLWAQGEPVQKVVPLLLIQYHRLLRASALFEAEPERFVEVLPLVDKLRSARGFFQQKAVEKDLAAAFKRAVLGCAFARELGELKPMAVAGLAARLPKVSAAEVRRVFAELLRLDFGMKTSSVDPELALEMIAARPLAEAAGSRR